MSKIKVNFGLCLGWIKGNSRNLRYSKYIHVLTELLTIRKLQPKLMLFYKTAGTQHFEKTKIYFVPLLKMEKQAIDKKKILKSVIKIVTDKEVMRSYIKGETSIHQLTKKGIKFAKPL